MRLSAAAYLLPCREAKLLKPPSAFKETALMKRFAAVLLFLAVGSMLPGCPIYDDDSSCSVDADCPSDYACDSLVGSCRPNSCTTPNQCATNQTCGRLGTCVPGDCSWEHVGCVSGYVCSSDSGVWECVRSSSGEGGGAGVSSGGSAGVTGSGGAAGTTGGAPDSTTGGSG